MNTSENILSRNTGIQQPVEMPGAWFPLKYWFDEINNKGIKKRKGEGKVRADEPEPGSSSGLRTTALLPCCLLGLLRPCCKSKEPHGGLCCWTPTATVARSGVSNRTSKTISIKSALSNSTKQSLDRYISAKTTGIILWSSHQSSGGRKTVCILKCLQVQR